MPGQHLKALAFCASLVVASLVLSGCTPKNPSPFLPAACVGTTKLTAECFDATYVRYVPLIRAGVQGGVALYLSKHPERVQHVVDVTGKVLTRLAQTELTTLATLEALIHDHVDWDGMDPAVRFAVQNVITAVRATLETILADIGLETPSQVRLVATDIMQAAYEQGVVQCSTCLSTVGLIQGDVL